MADTAAHLVDRVLPHVPVRQWVLSLPIQIRPMLAYDSKLSRAVLNTFLRVVFSWYRRQAKALGIDDAECGSVTAVQRFGSALNLNLHYHVLVMDGVFHQQTNGPPIFRETKAPTTEDIICLTSKIQKRIVRLFERRGLFNDDREVSSDEHALVTAYTASARGRVGFGENAGKLHARLLADAPMLAGKDKRAANISGFDLQFSDGTTHMVFEPMEFIDKLVAIIPRPRAHQVLYHGLLAPHAKRRSQVILKPTDTLKRRDQQEPKASAAVTREIRQRRLTWAELLRRVFAVDVLKCDKCGGSRTIIAAITQPDVIHAILTCLGLPTAAKRQHPARAPPQNELCFP